MALRPRIGGVCAAQRSRTRLGVLAALSVKHMAQRWSGFGEIVRRAPYVSGIIILAVGAYVGLSGWMHLAAT